DLRTDEGMAGRSHLIGGGVNRDAGLPRTPRFAGPLERSLEGAHPEGEVPAGCQPTPCMPPAGPDGRGSRLAKTEGGDERDTRHSPTISPAPARRPSRIRQLDGRAPPRG